MVACIHGDKSQQERDIVLRGKCCRSVTSSWPSLLCCIIISNCLFYKYCRQAKVFTSL